MRISQLMFLSGFAFTMAVQGQTTAPKPSVAIGDAAPDFTLASTTGTDFKLSEYKGKKNVVLAFFSAAFTGG